MRASLPTKDTPQRLVDGESLDQSDIAEGGQAIVGNVNAPAEGAGARKKTEDQPHAKQIAYAPEALANLF